MTEPRPDLSPLLPDDATLKARRAALLDAVSPEVQGSRSATGWRRLDLRAALGVVTAMAVVAVALIASAGGDNTPAAFAVEPHEGGVTIEVYRLEDAPGLEKALEDAGIQAQVTWLPAGMVCREPHYTPSIVHLPGGGTLGEMGMAGPGLGGMTIGVGSTQRWRESFGKHRRGEISEDELTNINLDPKAFRPDQSVVLFGTPAPHDGDPEGGSVAKLGIAEGPVEPCEPVPAPPSGSGSFGLSAGGGSDYTPIGDEALGQTAVAEALRQTAVAAEASETPVEAPPAPSQLLYTKMKVVQLQGWLPEDSPRRPAGSRKRPRYFTANLTGSPGVRIALVPTLKEVWTAADGTTRVRETLGRIAFLSEDDQIRWEEAGSPPPFAYDPDEHDVGRDSSGRPVKDFSSRSSRGRREFSYLSRVSRLPSEPEALRLTIENRRGGSSPVDPSPADSLRGGATVERLLEILSEPITTPALRAAAFNALAEIPGIGFERGVADVAGRDGDAISWIRERGFGRRLIFDPHTSEVLAEAEMIFKAKAADYPGVPDGTVLRETAYLQSGIVESTHERPNRATGSETAGESREVVEAHARRRLGTLSFIMR